MDLRRRTDPSERPPLRALLVDDDVNYRTFVAAVLRRAGILTVWSDDGEQALARIVAGEQFDLLLIDYEMPRLNGLQLIERLRLERATAATYAVMLTGRDDRETKIAALMAGFDDFMSKDAHEVELVAKITASKRLLMRQQTVDATMRELRGLASTDELTGLLNRRFFFEEAERVVSLSGLAALIIFDLDRFKDVNDTHGHLTGDQVLRDVASVLRAQTRYEDFVVRFGGDEFVMITQGVPVDQLEEIVRRVTDGVASLHWVVGKDSISVSVTAGVASTTLLPEQSLKALLEAADRDLYKNKYLKRTPAGESAQYEYGREKPADVVEFQHEEESRGPADKRADGSDSNS